MKKIGLLSLAILLNSGNAFADLLPNVWVSGYAQGWAEYSIADSKNKTLQISCNQGGDETSDHYVRFYPNGLDDERSLSEDELSFLIDGNAYYLSMSTFTRAGANEWIHFTQAISKGKDIKVYQNKKVIAKFKPTKQSIKKYASNIKGCKPKS